MADVRVAVSRNPFSPILLVAPHGHDDVGTAQIVEKAAELLDCSCVINYGWKRAKDFNLAQDECNCNNIEHLKNDVVKYEFLDPIMDIIFNFSNKGTIHIRPVVIIVHGVSNGMGCDIDAQIAVGFGDGEPPSHTCFKEERIAFLYSCKANQFKVIQALRGSKYAGWSKKNLNQLCYKGSELLEMESGLMMLEAAASLQVEIIKDLRDSEVQIYDTAEKLANTIGIFQDLLQYLDEKESNDDLVLPKHIHPTWVEIGSKVGGLTTS